MRRTPLEPGSPWVQLESTPEDWAAADPGLLTTMLGQLHLIRAFEETVLELAAESLVHGPAHSSIGQEGGAVGSIIGLRSTDAVGGSHRGHLADRGIPRRRKGFAHATGNHVGPPPGRGVPPR